MKAYPMKQRERFVPEFSSDSRVSIDRVMIDRFELKAGNWRVVDTPANIAEYLSNLTYMTLDGHGEDTIPLFKAKTCRQEASRHYLEFRKTGQGEGRNGEFPIISGKLIADVLAGKVQLNLPNRMCHIILDGPWNLTKFLQAQEFRIKTRLDRPQHLRPHALTISRKPDWWVAEHPYVEDFNILIGNAKRYGYALSKPLEDHVRDYINAVLVQVSGGLLEVGFSNVIENHIPFYQLGDIEFYWEFSHQDPITLVDTLVYYFSRAAKRFGTNSIQLEDKKCQTYRQSSCFWIKPIKTARIKVYAKTDQRIRLEICFSPEHRPRSVPRKQFTSQNDLIEAITALKEEAVSRVNGILENVWHIAPHNLNKVTPEQFSREVAVTADDPIIATTIMSALRTTGRISPFPADPLYPVLRELKKRGVLMISPVDGKSYIPTSKYNYAARALM